MEEIINNFNRVLPLNEDEKNLIREILIPKHFQRKEFVLRQGEVCNAFTFVAKGCLRVYTTDERANIHILLFATETWAVTDILSLREGTPALFNIDTLEPTEAYQISREDLKRLYTEAPKFNYIVRELLEKHHAYLQKRLLQMLSATAQERYYTFIKQYPDLLHRISHTQIAYYLGITPEFLSKIRSSK